MPWRKPSMVFTRLNWFTAGPLGRPKNPSNFRRCDGCIGLTTNLYSDPSAIFLQQKRRQTIIFNSPSKP